MLKKGINENNLNYWTNFFIDNYKYDLRTSTSKAKLICQEQEILKNKERIIKLEKKLKKLTKNK